MLKTQRKEEKHGGTGRLVVGLALQGRMLHLLPLMPGSATHLPGTGLSPHHPAATTDIAFAGSGHWIFLLGFVYLYIPNPQLIGKSSHQAIINLNN